MRHTALLVCSLLLSLAVLPAGVDAQTQADEVLPEQPGTVIARPAASARNFMVAAANPLAVEAGVEILRQGGSAADAAVAVQAVLGLVEPQSSGLGGGAFALWYDAASGTITTIDGRETAPASAGSDLFLDKDGKPLEFFDAVVGGRSVGVPGTVRLLEMLHGKFGRLDWQRLFDRAIELADGGFAVSPRLATLIEADATRLAGEHGTRYLFFTQEGEPLRAGDQLVNHDYGDTLRAIAQAGPDQFYEGAIADAIVDAVTLHPTNPGGLTLEDLATYRAIDREPVCVTYRGHEVCGMGPPSSGGITVGQILAMVEPFDLATLGPDDPESWRILGDATRLAFADREKYIADSDFVRVPTGLLDRNYLANRSELLRRPDALPSVEAGNPPWDRAELRLPGISAELPSTSHFVIVDADGNVASITSSIENGFGSRQVAAGFLLNNQLTDFSFLPGSGNALVANRVEPSKRPRSSMAPTIILKDGKPVYALGSPGGSNIIPYVATTIIALIDWQLDPQEAVSRPHLTNRFGSFDIERGTSAEALVPDLEALGFKTRLTDHVSGLHVIAIGEDGLAGGADPRREGVAAGD